MGEKCEGGGHLLSSRREVISFGCRAMAERVRRPKMSPNWVYAPCRNELAVICVAHSMATQQHRGGCVKQPRGSLPHPRYLTRSNGSTATRGPAFNSFAEERATDTLPFKEGNNWSQPCNRVVDDISQ